MQRQIKRDAFALRSYHFISGDICIAHPQGRETRREKYKVLELVDGSSEHCAQVRHRSSRKYCGRMKKTFFTRER